MHCCSGGVVDDYCHTARSPFSRLVPLLLTPDVELMATGTSGDIQQAKQRKTKLQAWVTRICATARSILSASRDELQTEIVVGTYNNLTSKFDNYKAACEHLIDLVDDDEELNTILNEMTAYDNDVEVLLVQLKKLQVQDHLPTSGQSASVTRATPMKLPKLELQPFNGETTAWPEFWDLFHVAIHINSQVPTVQKFAHLKSLLRGEAAKCIASIPTTESNYKVAIDRLQSRYGKPELLRHRLLTKITEMKHLENYKTLRDGVDELTATIRALEVQGVSEAEYGTILVPIVEARMPRYWKLLWARKKTEATVTFKDLIQFLETEVEVKEMADRDSFTSSALKQRDEITEVFEDYQADMSTATALHIKSSLKCTFCSGNHRPVDCTVPMTVDDRFRAVREVKACFRCAMPRHRASSCRWKKPCECGRLHIPQLCTGPRSNVTINAAAAPFHPCERPASEGETLSVHQAQGHGLRMRTVSIRLGNQIARALCDTGSTFTLMSSRLARSIPHQVIGKKKLRIQTFGSIMEEEFTVIRVIAEGVMCSATLTLDVLVSDAVIGTFEQLDAESVKIFRSHFGEAAVLADVPGNSTDPLDIIIGEDYYDQIVNGRPVPISGGLKATLTIFGWMLHGNKSQSSVHSNTACVLRATVQEQLAEFWNLEHLGVLASELNERDIEGDIRNNLSRDNCGRYTVEWPWKPHARQHLAPNKSLSEQRLQKLIARMSDEEYVAYDSHIQQLEIDGYIERLQQEDVPECFLPHRGVVKSSSTTTKLRIVYDASARSAGLLSLNDALEKGPNLLPLLWGILLRFRVGHIAVVGDLEKAFLQIKLCDKERNVCCFLWKPPNGHTVTYRLTRVFFGATSSPFLLQVVLKHHLESETVEGDIAHTLLRNLYVDDTVNSVDTESEAEEFWSKSVQIFQRGGFNLRKLQTNTKTLQPFSKDESVHKVLGISWNVEKDELIPLAEFKPTVKRVSKREIASLLASIYDPLGLIIPVVTPLKCLLQDLWKQKTAWDTTLDEVQEQRFRKILCDMMNPDSISVPRWLSTVIHNCAQDVSIHVFVDASCRAYAAVAYLCVKSVTETAATLLTAKCRLAPPGGETIPRLELMAVLMGARLLKSLMTEFTDVLPVKRWTLWSDSAIALSWVEKGPSVGGVFVANRVHEIRAIHVERRWVPSGCNPADLPTRGASIEELKESNLWWSGPSWLQLDEKWWPQSSVVNCVGGDDEETTPLSNIVMAASEPEVEWLVDLVEPKRTSKWNRTVRSVCWIMRWRYRNLSGSLEPAELKRASRLIFQQVQRKFFPRELIALEDNSDVPRQSAIKTFHPFWREGLLRMGGRLHQCNLPFEEKYPVLLKRCGVVDQLILHVHEQMQHGGPSFVISELRRDGIWILRSKKSVASVIRTCRQCFRFIAAPAAEVTAPLPDSRVTLSRAFDTTGMDLGGPLYIKDGSKCWFVLFTCMAVRAVHLELVTSLSEEALVLAVQRFVSRRGLPRKFASDHGSNFVALSHWLKDRGLPVEYEFTVERGPWWGGVWERLIRIVKCLLRRSIGKALLTWEQLETTLSEIEKVVNRRPISFQWESAQTDGVPLAVYPEQFLLPPRDVSEEQRDFLVSQQLQLRKAYFEDLAIVWKREYLHQVLGAKGEVWRSKPNPLQIGEVVLIGDDDKRLNWKLGVVEELHIGRDQRCRAAIVRVHNGLLRRPIQKLYKLELVLSADNNSLDIVDQSVDSFDNSDDVAVESLSVSDDTSVMTRAGRTVMLPARYRN